MSLRKHGGIWFVCIGRIGFNFYVSARKPARTNRVAELGTCGNI